MVFILIISSQDSDFTRTHWFSQLLFATVILQQLFRIIYSAFFINKQKYHSFGYWSPSLFYRFYSCAIIDSQIFVNFSVKLVKKCSVFYHDAINKMCFGNAIFKWHATVKSHKLVRGKLVSTSILIVKIICYENCVF